MQTMTKTAKTVTKTALAGLAVVLAVLPAGCAAKEDEATAKARAELAALPSLEDTRTGLLAATEQIANAARGVLPEAQWKNGGNEATLSCNSPYTDLGGSLYYSPNRVAVAVPLTGEQWAKIESAGKVAAAKIGATEVEVRRALPTDREVWFRGPAGMAIELAYQGNLAIAGTTGCRFPADNKGS